MSRMRKRSATNPKSFWSRTDGAVTVEFVMWVPVFFGLFLTIADVSILYLHQTNFLSVSQDTARLVSRHALEPAAAEDYAKDEARFGNYSPDVKVTVDERAATVTVTIVASAGKVAPFGVIGYAIGDTMTTSITQSLEPI
jgi:Flp pilus assembly protein TadG